MIRTRVNEVRETGRDTMGVQLINLGKRDAVVGIARNAEAGREAEEVDGDEAEDEHRRGRRDRRHGRGRGSPRPRSTRSSQRERSQGRRIGRFPRRWSGRRPVAPPRCDDPQGAHCARTLGRPTHPAPVRGVTAGTGTPLPDDPRPQRARRRPYQPHRRRRRPRCRRTAAAAARRAVPPAAGLPPAARGAPAPCARPRPARAPRRVPARRGCGWRRPTRGR